MAHLFRIDRVNNKIGFPFHTASKLLSLDASKNLSSDSSLLTPTFAGLTVTQETNGEVRVNIDNTSTGVSAFSTLALKSDTGRLFLSAFGSNYTTLPFYTNKAVLYDANICDGIVINATSNTGVISFGIGGHASSDEIAKIDINGLYVKGTTKLGDGGVTNYTKIEPDGTIEFNGAATVFKDINLGSALLTKPAASAPDTDEFKDEGGNDTGIETYAFAPGEKVSGNFELQHDYKEGSDITFHVHFQGITAPTGTDKVKWQLIYTVAKSDATLDAVTTIVKEIDFDTQYEFLRADFAVIIGTNFSIEDQFLFQLSRITASADEYAGDALIATVGIHYEIDTIGSRAINTK